LTVVDGRLFAPHQSGARGALSVFDATTGAALPSVVLSEQCRAEVMHGYDREWLFVMVDEGRLIITDLRPLLPRSP
jgi:hypothetical protein